MDQLIAEKLLSPPHVRLRRQYLDGVAPAVSGGVVALAAPDREHDVARHPELLLDPGERVAVIGIELAAACREAHERRLPEIIRGRLHELRLTGRRPLRPTRDIEVGQGE